MTFSEQMDAWLQAELLQGKIMIGIGSLLVISFIFILRNEHSLLKGTLIPMGLLMAVLIGYGGFILYSRPAHASTSLELFEKSHREGISLEIEKHTNDNKAGKTLLKIYPILAILSILPLLFGIPDYYKGLGLGFAIVFLATLIIDYGFVSRSDVFIDFLNSLNP